MFQAQAPGSEMQQSNAKMKSSKGYSSGQSHFSEINARLAEKNKYAAHSVQRYLKMCCCHGNKTKISKMAADGRHLGFSIFEILLNIERFCWKQLGNIISYVKTMI